MHAAPGMTVVDGSLVPGGTSRVFTDSNGIEWEVVYEGERSLELDLMLDHPMPTTAPGLLFISAQAIKRLWPAPEGWRDASDRELEELCERARDLL